MLRRTMIMLMLGLSYGPVAAVGRTDAGGKTGDHVQCRTALVNPVSGFAECVDPPGAPVPPPPPRPRQRCPRDLHGMVSPADVGCAPPSAASRAAPHE